MASEKTIGVGRCRVCGEGKSLLKTHICPECKAAADAAKPVDSVPPVIREAARYVYRDAESKLDELIAGLANNTANEYFGDDEMRFSTTLVDIAPLFGCEPQQLGPLVAAVYRLVRQREISEGHRG